MANEESEYMTTAEVAELFRTSQNTVRYWRFTGTGPPSAKVGTRVLYRRVDVAAWAEGKWAADRERGTHR
jgi:DNA-binding transcriptional MerR regulator